MRKRSTETRILPDPAGFTDWKTWARQLNVELARQLMSTSMVLPFFEFGIVTRTTDWTPNGTGIRWNSLVFDNTPGMWSNPDATIGKRLVVPQRPGGIQYGYAMCMAGISWNDPTVDGMVSTYFVKNGVLATPSGRFTTLLTTAYAPLGISYTIVQPWSEVIPGDYFEVFAERTGLSDATVQGNTPHTWASIVLAGPQ